MVAFSLNIPQDFNAFARYIRQFPEERFLEACSNFHLLLFMATCEILPLHTSFDSLLTCVRQKDTARLSAWYEGEEWQTVLQLLEHGKGLTVSFGKFPITVTSNRKVHLRFNDYCLSALYCTIVVYCLKV